MSMATIRETAQGWQIRNAIVPAAVLALACALMLAALRSEHQEALDVGFSVLAVEDPLNVGATTRATVEVENTTRGEVRPRFSVTWLPYPYYWRTVSGSDLLQPGDTSVYVIEATSPTSAPQHGQPFNIRVNDGRSIAYAISDEVLIPKEHSGIRNMRFGFWSQPDPATNLSSPAAWTAYEQRGTGDETRLRSVDALGVPAVQFHVAQDGVLDEGQWSHTGLTQKVPFPGEPFSITLLSQAPFEAQPGGWPVTAFGIEVSDPSNGLIWLLFQSTGTGDREYDLPSGHHIVVIDVPRDQWTTQTIDLSSMYDRLNWAPADELTLKLFIAASSSKANTLNGYVAYISPPN
jgi:hypothetical protein